MAKLHIISKIGVEYDHAAGTETTTYRAVWDDRWSTETLVKHVVSCTFDSDDSDEMTSVGEDFWLIPYNVDDPDGDWRDIREGDEAGNKIEIVE